MEKARVGRLEAVVAAHDGADLERPASRLD